MNRTDRLLAIVLELQGRGRCRAEDLARTFEVSTRTTYRDIQALCEAGVPIVSIPGRGYSLMEGYFLPPLSFSTDEATMLLLGSDVMAASFDEQYRAAAQSAHRKIAGVLPEKLRLEVASLRNSIHFHTEGAQMRPDLAAKLQQLRRAIVDRQHGRAAREVLPWLVGWGRHIHGLAPESLRQSVAEEAAAMMRNLAAPVDAPDILLSRASPTLVADDGDGPSQTNTG